ncbi:MAG: hypothetical protein KC501_22105 [Myxococcales bacterium]|nr:hypothetical protein [Myxococcales bacterium]
MRMSSGLIAIGLVGCAGGEVPGFSDSSLTFGPGGDTGPSTSSATSSDPDDGSGPGPDDSGGSGGSGAETGMTSLPPPDTGCEPNTEVCNGVDDDCNGSIDESDPMLGEPCDTGMPGECSAGTQVCDGGSLVCEPSGSAVPETCNGLDDDCDGTPDNGNPEGGGACSTGLPGICSAGTQTCNLGSLDCVQDMMAAPSDTCGNGLDDDCNGSADDGCLSCYDVDLGTGVPQSVGGSNAGGSDSFTSSCGGGADTIFRFEAPYAGSFTFDTIGSGFDTVLTAYSDCMGSELACNDDFAGNPDCGGYACSEISLALGAGQVVLIAVEGYSGATGAFTLNVS